MELVEWRTSSEVILEIGRVEAEERSPSRRTALTAQAVLVGASWRYMQDGQPQRHHL